MLTEIRDRSSGWFAWVIAALIIIPMTFWGVQEYANTEANPSLVKVGDQTISQAEFQQQFSNQQQRMRQVMGDNVDTNYLASDGFKQSVLSQMVNRALLSQVADDQKYLIGNEQLADAIKSSELFQTDGKFDELAYEQYVVGSAYSKALYETSLRQDKRLEQVTSGYEESALVLPDEVQTLLEFQAEKRSFDLLTVKQQDYLESVEVSDEMVGDYYTENKENFFDPERISVEYLEVSKDLLSADIEVSEEELLAIYEQNAEGYISNEQRDTRHILLSTTGDNKETEQLAKATKLVAELAAGADFAELAKENSQDPGSGSKGGSLGMVERGQMVPEFEEETFRLAEGEISQPIKSQFGYHIIQVTRINVPKQQTFEEVKFDLLEEERQQIAEERVLEKVEELRDLAFEQPDNLDAAAEQLGLTLNTSALFSRDSGVGAIASSTEVRATAFSDEVLLEGNNSEPIEINDGQYIVLRKAELKPAQAKPLSEVNEQIGAILKAEKAAAEAKQAGETLLATAQKNWADVSGNEDLEVSSYTVAILDNERTVSPLVLQAVGEAHLRDGAPRVLSVSDNNGDFHIVRFTKIEAGDIEGVSEQVKDSTRRLLSQRNGQSMMQSYIESLNESFSPEVNTDLL